MTRSRDLSGFGTAPAPSATPPPEPTIPPPPRLAKPKTKRSRKASTPEAGVRRITLSLPTSIAARLKATARRDATYYLDVILNALVDHGAAVQADHEASRRIGKLEVAPLRRRRPPGRTQIPLNIPADALAEVDRAATECGLDRSGFIAELLDHAL